MALEVGQRLTLQMTLVSNLDRGNVVFESPGFPEEGDRPEQVNVDHRGLLPVSVIDAQRKHNVALHQLGALRIRGISDRIEAVGAETVTQALDALVPLRKEMALPAEIRSLRDRSSVIVFIGASVEDARAPEGRRYNPHGREVLLPERHIRAAAGLPLVDPAPAPEPAPEPVRVASAEGDPRDGESQSA